MSKSYIYHILIIISLCLTGFSAFSQDLDDDKPTKEKKFSLKTGSFTYYLGGGRQNPGYTEMFNNQLVAAGFKVSDPGELVLGTFINSYGDRCMLLGYGRRWKDFNSKLSFEGLYAYAGEIGISQTNNCQDGGFYKTFNDHLGLGFAPYLYHGVKYKLTSIVSLELGLIFPKVLAGSLRWDF